MKTPHFAALGIFAASLAVPSVAHAQGEEQTVEPFVGASVGYHDIGTDIPDDDGVIYGVVAGVDVPVGETFFVGAEGNFHFGDNIIDNEYGIAARAGVRVGNKSKLYVKGGYQEVDFDLGALAGVTVPAGTDTSEGDYLLGIGADIGVGESPLKIRVGLDTIAFDSTRVTGGVLYAF